MADLEALKIKTAELLDEGLATGALTPSDYSWRRGNLDRARSVDDLERLVEDLLIPDQGGRTGALTVPKVELAVVMGRRTFRFNELGRVSEVAAVMGSSTLDLTGAGPLDPLHLEVAVVMGDMVVEVPPGVKVRISADVVMGQCTVDPAVSDPEAPVLITGAVVLGNLRVVPKRLAL